MKKWLYVAVLSLSILFSFFAPSVTTAAAQDGYFSTGLPDQH